MFLIAYMQTVVNVNLPSKYMLGDDIVSTFSNLKIVQHQIPIPNSHHNAKQMQKKSKNKE